MMARKATICMMIMTLLTIFSLSELASLTRRQIAQTKTMQEATSDSYSMSLVMYAALYSTLIANTQTIAGMATLTRQTMALTVLRRQLWVSSGRFFEISSSR